VLSWNVNGIRSAAGKGLGAWLDACGADAVALQEVRATPEQAREALGGHLDGWHMEVAPAEKAGYSGVALLARRPPDAWIRGLGDEAFDREGRLLGARFGRFVVLGGYFPNGNGPQRDHSRIPYKLAFTAAVRAEAERLGRGGRRVLVIGDFNTAHREIDLARPTANVKTSGFTPVEREALDAWLQAGWVDTFRRFEPAGGHYTWWSQRQGVRERNIGWRIDLGLATAAAARHLERAWHEPEVTGSDHCPVGVAFGPAVVGTARISDPR
jgi:exodeoxyribonuclease-3